VLPAQAQQRRRTEQLRVADTAALLSAAAVPMRRAGLNVVVDVDPQSL
jgi:hypothetical protein